jgi:hypothetical protein
MRNSGEIGIDPFERYIMLLFSSGESLGLGGARPGSVEMYYTISVERQCDTDTVQKENRSIYLFFLHSTISTVTLPFDRRRSGHWPICSSRTLYWRRFLR